MDVRKGTLYSRKEFSGRVSTVQSLEIRSVQHRVPGRLVPHRDLRPFKYLLGGSANVKISATHGTSDYRERMPCFGVINRTKLI